MRWKTTPCKFMAYVKTVKKTDKKIKEELLVFDNKFIQQRIEKVEILRNAGINPYANESKRNATIEKFLNVNSDVIHKENKRDEKRHYTISGRIKLFRIMGKASFIQIEDESNVLQIYVARDHIGEEFYNETFKKT